MVTHKAPWSVYSFTFTFLLFVMLYVFLYLFSNFPSLSLAFNFISSRPVHRTCRPTVFSRTHNRAWFLLTSPVPQRLFNQLLQSSYIIQSFLIHRHTYHRTFFHFLPFFTTLPSFFPGKTPTALGSKYQ